MIKPPLTVDWHITQRCNLTCKHCYAAGEQFQGETEHQGTIRIIDKILSLKNDFNIRVTLTGGEPLLRYDVFKIASSLSEDNIPTSLTTNGMRVQKNIDKIINSGIMQIQVSIDGMRRVHDYLRGLNSFDPAICALRLLKRENLLPSVMTTVNSYNFKQVPEITPGNYRDLLKYVMNKKEELKGETCILTPDPLKVLIDRRESAGCPIGNSILALTPNGDMLPCCKLPINLGNILSVDFHDACNSKIINTMRDGCNLKGKCGHCEHKEICRGCRAAAYAAYGDYLAEDPQCWLTQGL